MRQNLIIFLYFLSLVFLILLLGPGYLLSVVQLMQLLEEFDIIIWMPHPTYQNSVVGNTLVGDGFDEIQHFNCPWTITTNNESITVNIIDLKWTFNYDFWIRVEIQPQGNAKASHLLDVDELHPLFKSLATALLNYYEFPEPQLTEFQLHVYGELMDRLSYKVKATFRSLSSSGNDNSVWIKKFRSVLEICYSIVFVFKRNLVLSSLRTIYAKEGPANYVHLSDCLYPLVS